MEVGGGAGPAWAGGLRWHVAGWLGWRSFLVQVPLDGLLLLAGTNFWSSRRTSRCLLRRRSISAGQRANSGTLAGTLRASHKTSATESNIQPTHPKLRQRQVRSLVAPSLAFRALKRLRSSEIGRFRKIGLLAMFPPPPATAWVRPTHRGFFTSRTPPAPPRGAPRRRSHIYLAGFVRRKKTSASHAVRRADRATAVD